MMLRTVKKPFSNLLMTSLLAGALAVEVAAQTDWTVPRRTQDVLIDGYITEWEGVPAIELKPGSSGVTAEGEFKENDVSLRIQAQWDDQYLYLALAWRDDTWDVEEVSRREAVWVDGGGKRRDRMLLFDFLKLHIRQANYDYTAWLSPRHQEQGPFLWNRLLEGYRGMERASASPMVTAREHDDGSVTMELMFLWRELRQKPKDGFPITLTLADSDLPGRLPEYKVGFLKSLTWRGRWQFAK